MGTFPLGTLGLASAPKLQFGNFRLGIFALEPWLRTCAYDRLLGYCGLTLSAWELSWGELLVGRTAPAGGAKGTKGENCSNQRTGSGELAFKETE